MDFDYLIELIIIIYIIIIKIIIFLIQYLLRIIFFKPKHEKIQYFSIIFK